MNVAASRIWWLAFGYFACYAPYSALTKAVSSRLVPGMARPVSGLAMLPLSAMATLVGMLVFLTAMGWWKHAGRRTILGRSLPCPGPWTFLSGLCTAAIIGTTTLAYTFEGVSIVFMMVLMRGGVLVLAPVVDAITGRHVRWFSWAAFVISLAAVFTTLVEKREFAITALAVTDVALYLGAYFVRLQFMTRLSKSEDEGARLRFFVEEQMTATPAFLLTLLALALFGGDPGSIGGEIRAGFSDLAAGGAVLAIVAIGILSQGTGIFGSLVLLERSENTFCVPVNRCSSVLAGLIASYGLVLAFGQKLPGNGELISAGMIVTAILFLSVPPLLGRKAA